MFKCYILFNVYKISSNFNDKYKKKLFLNK